jgi:hypothetical protein
MPDIPPPITISLENLSPAYCASSGITSLNNFV